MLVISKFSFVFKLICLIICARPLPLPLPPHRRQRDQQRVANLHRPDPRRTPGNGGDPQYQLRILRGRRGSDETVEMARDLEAQLKRESELRQQTAISERDAVVAQNLEQELRDEDLARQYAMAEEAALRANNGAGAAVGRPTPSRRRRICSKIWFDKMF